MTRANDRYDVQVIGTPDPASTQYFVLDIVNDVEARVALAKLGKSYGDRGYSAKADACFAALHATQDAHQAVMVERTQRMTDKKRSKERQS